MAERIVCGLCGTEDACEFALRGKSFYCVGNGCLGIVDGTTDLLAAIFGRGGVT